MSTSGIKKQMKNNTMRESLQSVLRMFYNKDERHNKMTFEEWKKVFFQELKETCERVKKERKK